MRTARVEGKAESDALVDLFPSIELENSVRVAT